MIPRPANPLIVALDLPDIDRAESLGQFLTTYGGSNPVEANNTYNAAWCIDAWTLGANGVIPWQTVGRDSSWKQGETTCVLYPGGPAGSKEPIPSIRLKAYLRGQDRKSTRLNSSH